VLDGLSSIHWECGAPGIVTTARPQWPVALVISASLCSGIECALLQSEMRAATSAEVAVALVAVALVAAAAAVAAAALIDA
jgi:hypothetical protein